MKKFPIGEYGRQKLQFFPAPFRAPLRAFASLVFPWQEERILLCHIGDRGWCIPSGRVEPNESSLEAAHREALEEAGAILCHMQYIGCYRVTERMAVRWADCYVARVDHLVEITHTEESLGRQWVTREELPEIYHLWNPLIEQMFEHSQEILQRLLDRQF